MGAAASVDGIRHWTKEQVSGHIRTLGTDFEVYADIFLRESITGKLAVKLKIDEIQALGVTSLEHRQRIVQELDRKQARPLSRGSRSSIKMSLYRRTSSGRTTSSKYFPFALFAREAIEIVDKDTKSTCKKTTLATNISPSGQPRAVIRQAPPYKIGRQLQPIKSKSSKPAEPTALPTPSDKDCCAIYSVTKSVSDGELESKATVSSNISKTKSAPGPLGRKKSTPTLHPIRRPLAVRVDKTKAFAPITGKSPTGDEDLASTSNGLVFISYARGDEATPFAKWLSKQLTAAGIKTWIDCESIPSGADWSAAIGDAIRACSALIAVIDPKYCGSDFCKGELWMALGRSKRVFPIMFRSMEFCHLPSDVEYRLGTIHCHTFDLPDRDLTNLVKITAAIKKVYASQQQLEEPLSPATSAAVLATVKELTGASPQDILSRRLSLKKLETSIGYEMKASLGPSPLSSSAFGSTLESTTGSAGSIRGSLGGSTLSSSKTQDQDQLLAETGSITGSGKRKERKSIVPRSEAMDMAYAAANNAALRHSPQLKGNFRKLEGRPTVGSIKYNWKERLSQASGYQAAKKQIDIQNATEEYITAILTYEADGTEVVEGTMNIVDPKSERRTVSPLRKSEVELRSGTEKLYITILHGSHASHWKVVMLNRCVQARNTLIIRQDHLEAPGLAFLHDFPVNSPQKNTARRLSDTSDTNTQRLLSSNASSLSTVELAQSVHVGAGATQDTSLDGFSGE